MQGHVRCASDDEVREFLGGKVEGVGSPDDVMPAGWSRWFIEGTALGSSMARCDLAAGLLTTGFNEGGFVLIYDTELGDREANLHVLDVLLRHAGVPGGSNRWLSFDGSDSSRLVARAIVMLAMVSSWSFWLIDKGRSFAIGMDHDDWLAIHASSSGEADGYRSFFAKVIRSGRTGPA